MTLPDGRTLGFAQYGDPNGHPVVYFHGGLSCRIDATSVDPVAAEMGINVIAPDRPGVGLSDRHKGASLLDWPDDVSALADELDFDRFAVMGWSFGGAYAASCGYALAERVRATVLIASGIPRDWTGMLEGIDRMDRIFLKLSGRGALLDEGAFVAIRKLARTAPALFVKQAVSTMSEQSRDAIARDPQEFIDATVMALADPGGALDDYRIWNRPWGFDVAQIPGPVQVWQGDQDELCPPEWAQRLENTIPTAELHMVPGAGHFVARDHWAEILDSALRG